MINISEILTASYVSSREADQTGKDLKGFTGANSNYEVVRLALGRSLGLESFPESAPDAKGSPIKGMQLFGDEDSCNYLWIGLLGEILRRRGEDCLTLDTLQKLVRDHWHRGIVLLAKDRDEAEDDFKVFLEILARKANLPEQNSSSGSNSVAEENEGVELGEEQKTLLTKHLKAIGITAEVRSTLVGPRVNRYKLFLQKSTDRRALENALDELGFALGIGSCLSLSDAQEPKTCFLYEPRKKAEWHVVDINDFGCAVAKFDFASMKLPVSPGVMVDGHPLVFDLANAPHVFLGGTTGSGKSVCLNAILLGLLTYSDAKKIQFALIDPKKVEFSIWRNYKYLFGSIATDSVSAAILLEQLVQEMEARYERFSALDVKDIVEAQNKGDGAKWIIVAVDELADLVMQDKSCEEFLERLAQKGRAAGIHLILATQRPDAKTFSGILRTNCPTRIALRVSRASESKIIMDEDGAERLQGAGDMIFRGVDGSSVRAHAYYITAENIISKMRP